MRIISKSLIFKSKWIEVTNEILKKSDTIFEFTLIKPKSSVIIIAKTKKGQYIMMNQYRHGIKRIHLGFPAGYIEKNESVLKAAKRELLEETGFIGENHIQIASLCSDPTRVRGKYYIVSISNCVKNQKICNPDPGEADITLRFVDKAEFYSSKLLDSIGSGTMLSAIPYIFKK